MAIRDDERAQTVQVGAILLLGTLVVALSVYQVTSVPGQNSETEFTHNQQVHEQLQELRTAILETAAEGTGRSAAVALGTRYRERIVAVNPGPPSGTLRTTDLSGVTIANAVAVGNLETVDFWNGSAKRYGSTALTYEPNYNEYSNAPTTVYEHSVLANRFEEGDRPTLLLSNETMVDGRDITLVTLDGSLSRTGSGTVSIDTRPLSVSSTTIPIRNASGGTGYAHAPDDASRIPVARPPRKRDVRRADRVHRGLPSKPGDDPTRARRDLPAPDGEDRRRERHDH